METSRVDQLYGVFDSQVFWGFITLILAAAAFSGKLNMNASAACLALAWVVGCVGIYKSDAIRDWYWMIAIWLALGAILAMLALWFQPSVPKKETTGSKSLPVLLKKQISSPDQREQIRWEIKPFITRGYDVLHLYESHLLADEGVWQEWVQEVSDFLRESFNESYVDYWGNHNGLKPFWSPLPVAVPERNRKLYADTFYRLKRLGEIHESLKG